MFVTAPYRGLGQGHPSDLRYGLALCPAPLWRLCITYGLWQGPWSWVVMWNLPAPFLAVLQVLFYYKEETTVTDRGI